MNDLTGEQIRKFREAAVELEARFAEARFDDDNVEQGLHAWLDDADEPLPWTDPAHVTPDEWFFVTTLYGEMTMEGQRTHIRKHFPAMLVELAQRDIRNFKPGMPGFEQLRSTWMSQRLCRMGEVLRERGLSMTDYSKHLRALDASASSSNPMPALDAIIADHQATGWKTLSCFVRDCVGGNAFPIDSRVQKELERHGLPADERVLVGVSLMFKRNPRRLARMFFEAGGTPG